MQRVIDNASPQIEYYPAWDTSPDPAVTPEQATHEYYRGTLAQSANAGQRAVLRFQGDSVRVVGTRGYSHGNYTVQLDDGPVEMYSGVAREREFRAQLYARADLGRGNHTLTITNVPVPRADTSGSRLDLDYIMLGIPASSVFSTFMDDTHPSILYSSDWTATRQAGRWLRNDTAHETTTGRASFTVPFTGTAIQLYGVLDSAYGNYTVSVDGGPSEMYRATWREYLHDMNMFTVAGLEQGEHNVTVTAVGTTGGSRVVFDYAVVNGTAYSPGSGPVAAVAMPSASSLDGSIATGLLSPSASAAGPPGTSGSNSSGSNSSGSTSPPLGAIIGGAIAGVLLIVLIVLGVCLFRRRRARRPLSVQPAERKDFSIDASPSPVEPGRGRGPATTTTPGLSPFPIKEPDEPEESVYSSGSYVSEFSAQQRDRLLSMILANPGMLRGDTLASSAALPDSHYAPSVAASSQVVPRERERERERERAPPMPVPSPSVAMPPSPISGPVSVAGSGRAAAAAGPSTPVTAKSAYTFGISPVTPRNRPSPASLGRLAVPSPAASDPSPAFIREHKIPTIIETERGRGSGQGAERVSEERYEDVGTVPPDYASAMAESQQGSPGSRRV